MISILTDENFDKEIQAIDKPVLVDFFADWCGPCFVLGPILEKIADEFNGQFVLIKADLGSIPLTAQKFGVERIPTVILFKKGKPAGGFVGLRPKEGIEEWLKGALGSEQEKIEEMINWYSDYAKDNGFNLNPDREAVKRIIKGLLENEKKYGKKYCPCRRVAGEGEIDSKNICPCYHHKDEIEKEGHCSCMLFVK